VTIKSSASLISVRPKCRKNNFFAFWLLGNEFFAFKVFIIAIRIFGLLFGSAGMLKKCGRKILGVLQQQTIFANAACLWMNPIKKCLTNFLNQKKMKHYLWKTEVKTLSLIQFSIEKNHVYDNHEGWKIVVQSGAMTYQLSVKLTWQLSLVVRHEPYMAKSYYGTCFFCKSYGEVTFRMMKSHEEEEEQEGQKKRGKRIIICLNCVHWPCTKFCKH